MRLEEAIDICANTVFENTKRDEGLPKIEFKELLSHATKESYSIFNGKLRKQVDGVATGSSLGPKLANCFVVYFEKYWLQSCPYDFKSHYYWRYTDDIFASFNSPEHLEAFQDFLNANMSFYNWK